MKHYRILFTILLCVVIIPLGFGQKKVVTSSASMIWDMVDEIAGDKIENRLIVPIGGDPHTYSPTPVDAQKVATSDLIFVNGLTFEGWINELIANSGTKGETITVTKGLKPIASSDYDNAYDPHAWMDVSMAQTYISNILAGLIKMDPANKEFYVENHRAYAKKLMELDSYITNRINEIPEKQRLLITSHDAFSYYGKKYGLDVQGIIGISTESEAQTSDIVRISKAIKDSGVPAIFIESTINPKLIKQIATDNGVAIGGSLYADSIGEKTSSGNSYYNMLKSNTDVIVDALTGKKNTAVTNTDTSGSSLMTYLILGAVLLLGLIFFGMKMNK